MCHFKLELPIHLGVEAITDLCVTLPQDVTAVPQQYTVHCLINQTCKCDAYESSFNFYMFMEGVVGEQATDYCSEEPSLSCTEVLESSDAPIVDNQLTVTWDAKTVLKQGDYHTPSTPANGDHDFLCVTSYADSGSFTGGMKSEEAFVSIRGIYMHSHACK